MPLHGAFLSEATVAARAPGIAHRSALTAAVCGSVTGESLLALAAGAILTGIALESGSRLQTKRVGIIEVDAGIRATIGIGRAL